MIIVYKLLPFFRENNDKYLNSFHKKTTYGTILRESLLVNPFQNICQNCACNSVSTIRKFAMVRRIEKKVYLYSIKMLYNLPCR